MSIIAEALPLPQQHIVVIAVPLLETQVTQMPVFPIVIRFVGFIIIMMFIFFMVSYFT